MAPRTAALAAIALLACGGGGPFGAPGSPRDGAATAGEEGARARRVVRVALFNVRELAASKLADLGPAGEGRDPQLRAAAAIVQRVRPDLLVLQEIDLPADVETGAPAAASAASAGSAAWAASARRFADAYLGRGDRPLAFPHAFAAASNTGLASGFDLDRDGRVATGADLGSREYGGDAWGFGTYPGQYAMALLSRFPIDEGRVRTFQRFLWRDLPGHHQPAGFYPPEVAARLRLSSKSHWDVPVDVGGRPLHLWISHPTPPAFDGPEDRNGRRNFDEIAFWVRYLEGSEALVDDAGGRGGYRAGAPFVIAGDLNARPADPASVFDGVTAIGQLLDHPRIQDTGRLLTSPGAAEAAAAAAAAAAGDEAPSAAEPAPPPRHPERATADFLGGVQVDYLLPGHGLEVVGGGVFWPAAADDPEGHRLALAASDHRLVWLDLALPPP